LHISVPELVSVSLPELSTEERSRILRACWAMNRRLVTVYSVRKANFSLLIGIEGMEPGDVVRLLRSMTGACSPGGTFQLGDADRTSLGIKRLLDGWQHSADVEGFLRTTSSAGLEYDLVISARPARGFLDRFRISAHLREVSEDLSKAEASIRSIVTEREGGRSEGREEVRPELLPRMERMRRELWRASELLEEGWAVSVEVLAHDGPAVRVLKPLARSYLMAELERSRRPREHYLTTKELAVLLRTGPVLSPSLSYAVVRREVFHRPMRGEAGGRGLLIGFSHGPGGRVPVSVPIEHLPHSLAVFGSPGSGKTSLVKALLTRLRSLGIRYLVLDRHGEYRENADVVVGPGGDVEGLKLLTAESDPEEESVFLSDIFSMAWPEEFGPLQSAVFRTAYRRFRAEFKDFRPSLFVRYLEGSGSELIRGFLDSRRARDALFSLYSRISELADGSASRFIEGGEGAIGIGELLTEDAVIDLSSLSSERERNVVSWLVLKAIFEQRRRSGRGSKIHVVVCEEAHNLLPRTETGRTTIVEQMLREVRKFGESVWIVDQRPSRISDDAVSLPGTVICKRLTGADDLEVVSERMMLNDAQRDALATLGWEEAVVTTPRTGRAVKVVWRAGTERVDEGRLQRCGLQP